MLTLYKIKNLWSTISLLALLLITPDAKACDVCGCAVGGMSMGLGMETTNNYFGLRYSHVQFNAQINYNSQYLEDIYSNDSYHRMELTSKYHFTPKIYGMAILPVVYNTMRGNTENIAHASLGDASLGLAYRLISPPMDTTKIRGHLLDIGANISLPTGAYQLEHEGEIVNRNFQAGKGSFAYSAVVKYMFMFKKWRYTTDLSYGWNTVNKDDYHFGNQLNVFASFGRLFNWGNTTIYPSLGAYFEHGEQHTEDGKIVFNTGGNAVLADIGVAVKTSKLTYWMKFLPVIHQSYNVDALSTIRGGKRLNLGIRYRF
ncbi:hypothetical protein SAMN05216474_0293 [Lishizhenia tianjinensis]|uniref:MetA-pathway of phenol degradation n=1 Tax=Lishizhenia tianjinensis TaxID=477690 RepID=A0A1I6XLV9_9FLAO|nr:hypothetical protein [Lishizhenia tianjinensis]SFT39126.1 hypothetical protein SAMN05216474_0293 [Lishizhenia tianjinensis]